MGGTLLNRHAALREVEDRICVTNRVTVVVIRQGDSKNRSLAGMTKEANRIL
jgi:hypothetical protein